MTRIIGRLLAHILLFFMMSFIVMSLWNWLMPSIFGVVKINFFQAMGIKILSAVLFKKLNSGEEVK